MRVIRFQLSNIAALKLNIFHFSNFHSEIVVLISVTCVSWTHGIFSKKANKSVRDGAKTKLCTEKKQKGRKPLTNAYKQRANKNGQLNEGNVPWKIRSIRLALHNRSFQFDFHYVNPLKSNIAPITLTFQSNDFLFISFFFCCYCCLFSLVPPIRRY